MIEVKPVDYPQPQGQMALRLVGSISDNIIHHSAGSKFQTPLEIDAEHRARGMDMIGYNYLVDAEGNVYAGRPVIYIPAAAYGRNPESINICVIGNFQSDDPGYTGIPTAQQVSALSSLVALLHHKYPTIVRTIGHRDVAPMFYAHDEDDYSTACPGNKLYELIPQIKRYTLAQLAKL